MSTRRGIKTIIGSFFRKRGQMGAEASNATFSTAYWTFFVDFELFRGDFFAAFFFVVALAGCGSSWMMWWFPYHLFSDEVYNIIVVNSPDSFRKFNEDMQPELDEMAEDYGDRYDYFANWENMADFEYI